MLAKIQILQFVRTVCYNCPDLTDKNMTTINVRTDEKQKKLATAILKEMGLDMSSAIKLFLQQVILTKSIPFPIRTVNGYTVEAEQAMLKDAAELEADIEAGTAKGYSSAREMLDDLINE